jgi:hypothetical protein
MKLWLLMPSSVYDRSFALNGDFEIQKYDLQSVIVCHSADDAFKFKDKQPNNYQVVLQVEPNPEDVSNGLTAVFLGNGIVRFRGKVLRVIR